MPDSSPGLTSKDFREQHAVATLKRNGAGAAAPIDPLQQVFDDTRKASAIKLLTAQDKSLETDILHAENDRLKAEIDNAQLKEMRGGPTAGPNPEKEFLYRQLESAQARLDRAQEQAQVAQAAILEERMALLREELERINAAPPPATRDEMEDAMTTVDKALSLADRLRPAAREIVERGPDPGLRRFELTLEADRENRRMDAEERRAQLNMDLQLKRESLAREEARLEKQAASQERFMTETVPKILQLGQQLVETLTAKLGAPAAFAPVVAPAVAPAVRGERAPAPATGPAARSREVVIPAGAAGMTCQACGALIIYREGAPEVFCSGCGALYTNDFKDPAGSDSDVVSAEQGGPPDAQAWADSQREERHGVSTDARADSDPAIPA